MSGLISMAPCEMSVSVRMASAPLSSRIGMADREPLRVKPVGDDGMAFGASAWCKRRRAKLPRHSARRTERRLSIGTRRSGMLDGHLAIIL